jgi:hypothetical protein
MKDQYVGDVNDYFKYALLRALTGPDDELVVAWMLTPGDGRTDGRRLSYLGQPNRYRRLDSPLFDALHAALATGTRNVQAVEQAGVLPGAVFVPGVLGDGLLDRRRYFDDVWAASAGRTLLFFDPDNGMAVRSVRRGARNSAKYLYWDELGVAYRQDISLVVYQHFPRRPRPIFLDELARKIHEGTGSSCVLALSTAHVAFLVVPQPGHSGVLESRLNAFSANASPFAAATVSMMSA